jgi:hypothetical protein
MRIFVFTATYELRVSRKSHLRDHPTYAARMGTGTKRLSVTNGGSIRKKEK